MTPFNPVMFEGFQRYVIRCTVAHQRYNKSANLGGDDYTPSPSSRSVYYIHRYIMGNPWQYLRLLVRGFGACKTNHGKSKHFGKLLCLKRFFASDVSSWFCPRFTFWFRHQAPRAPDMSSQPMTRESRKCTL